MKTLLKASLLLMVSIGSAAGAEVPSYRSDYGGGVATRPLTVPGGSIYAPSYSSPSYGGSSFIDSVNRGIDEQNRRNEDRQREQEQNRRNEAYERRINQLESQQQEQQQQEQPYYNPYAPRDSFDFLQRDLRPR